MNFINDTFTEIIHRLEVEDFEFMIEYESPQAILHLDASSDLKFKIQNEAPNHDGRMPICMYANSILIIRDGTVPEIMGILLNTRQYESVQ